MKLKIKFIPVIPLLMIILLFLPACAEDQELSKAAIADDEAVKVMEVLSLTPDEEAMIIYMREEEKLAHDIYTELAGIYTIMAFDNISAAETRHVNRVIYLLNHFGIEDPASDEPGEFVNEELGALYAELLETGKASLIQGLFVGATIEDRDIHDLDSLIQNTSDPIIIEIFECLSCGSRNHLRAFTSLLDRRGESYTPQYISVELFDTILEESHEFCGMAN